MLISNCKSDYLDYETAKLYCLFLEEQGKKGWRLPTLLEWADTADGRLTTNTWYRESTNEERALLAKQYNHTQQAIEAMIEPYENRKTGIAIAVRDK
jgi:formylglycine-generating enzyme required for sulfatase activity